MYHLVTMHNVAHRWRERP